MTVTRSSGWSPPIPPPDIPVTTGHLRNLLLNEVNLKSDFVLRFTVSIASSYRKFRESCKNAHCSAHLHKAHVVLHKVHIIHIAHSSFGSVLPVTSGLVRNLQSNKVNLKNNVVLRFTVVIASYSFGCGFGNQIRV